MTGQRLVDAVTGGTRYRQPSRGRYRRPCRLFCPPEREAGAVALAQRLYMVWLVTTVCSVVASPAC